MTVLRAAAGVVMASGLLLAIGCTAAPDVESEHTSRAVPLPSAATADAGAPRFLTEAVPLPESAYEVIARVPVLEDGVNSGILAIDDAGTALFAEAPQSAGMTLRQPTVVLRSLADPGADEETFTASPRPRNPQQAISGTFNDRFAVWVETPSTELGVNPWVLYGYDRRSGNVSELARAPELDGAAPPPPPGYTGPVLIGSRVFWAQVSGTGGAERVDIVGCEIADCQPRTYLDGAAFPATDGSALFAIATARYEGRQSSDSMTVKRLTPDTQEVTDVQTARLPAGASPGGLAVSTHRLAWIVAGGGDRLTVWDSATGNETMFQAAGGSTIAYPVLTDQYLAWADGSGSGRFANYLADLESGDLFGVGATGSLYGVEGNGDLLAWRDQDGPADSPDLHGITHTIARIDTKSSSTRRGVPTASATTTAEPLLASEAEQLPTGAYRELFRSPVTAHGRSASIMAVDSDGTALISERPASVDLTLHQPTIVLRATDSDAATERFQATPLPARAQQATSGAFNDRYVVWMETVSMEAGVQPWVLYAYDRRSERVHQLAESPTVGDAEPPPPPGYSGVQLAGELVFWAQVGGTPGGERVDIMGCEVVRCEPQTLLPGAAFPATDGVDVYAISEQRFRGKSHGTQMAIVKHSAETGETSTVKTVELSDGAAPLGLSVTEQHLLWIHGPVDRVTILDRATGEETVVRASGDARFTFPTLTHRFAAWGTWSGHGGFGNHLYDLASGVLYGMGHDNSSGITGADGDVVSWIDGPDRIEQVVARLAPAARD